MREIIFFPFFVSKIPPELTSIASLPLFFFFGVRKIPPELTSVPIFLYFVCGMPPQHGWWVEQVCARDPNLQTWAAKVKYVEL